MRPIIVALVLAGASLVLAGCPGDKLCDATTCSGCCAEDGLCLAGDTETACGRGGGSCQRCEGSSHCGVEGLCVIDNPRPDGGTDAGEADGGVPDAGPTDGGVPDAGPTDGGVDAGHADGGLDAGPGSCAAPRALNADGGPTRGTLQGQPNQMSSYYCGGGTGPDNVYQFTTTEPGIVTAWVAPDDAGFRPILYMRSPCGGSSPDLACTFGGVTGGAAQFETYAPAGTYWLWVDSAGAESGAYQLGAQVAPDAGEHCPLGIPLVFAGGEAHASGEFGPRVNDTTGSCSTGSGPDVVYTFTTTEPWELSAEYYSSAFFSRPSMYLRSACGSGELACSYATSSSDPNIATYLPPGTYWLWLDNSEATTASYTLNAHLRPPRPQGDRCLNPKPLVFSNGSLGGTAHDSQDTNNFADEGELCGSYSYSPDVVYTFTTSVPRRFHAQVTSVSAGLPVVALRSACSGSSLTCDYFDIFQSYLQPGTYYLWVEGSRAGEYTLDAELTDPVPGDSCHTEKTLVFSDGLDGGTATDTDDTNNMIDDYYACSSGASVTKDAVYGFSTGRVLNLRATVTPLAPSEVPVVALKSGACEGFTTLQCVRAAAGGEPATLIQGSLPPGTYHLFVDNFYYGGFPYRLDVALFPPPVGDTCEAPKPLTFSNGGAGGTASASGDTGSGLLADDAYSYCGGDAPDEVYEFTTTELLDLRAQLSTPTPIYSSVLSVRPAAAGTCGSTTGYRTCQAASAPGGPVNFATNALTPGTYRLVVDGTGGTAGQYNLSASLTPPAPGDTCANPQPLVFSGGTSGGTANETGSTLGYFDDSDLCASYVSPDRVYRFDTDQLLNFRATATTTTSNYYPSLSLVGSTCGGPSLVCKSATTRGSPVTVAKGSLPAGTYHLWVDGYLNVGDYNLSASLVPTPVGDSCARPRDLVFSGGGTGGTASASGDTSATGVFDDDKSSICSSSTASLDEVYRISFTSPNLDLRAEVVPTDGALQPVVYVRTSACSTGEINCGLALSAGGAAKTEAHRLFPGTYYLWVDGLSGTTGSYTLSATLQRHVVGDDCYDSLPLTFTNGTATATGDTTGLRDDVFGSCGGAGAPDVNYLVYLSAPRTLTVRVAAGSAGYTPAIYLRSYACDWSEAACAVAPGPGGTATLTVSLSSGSHYLWVDGSGGSGGPYTLTATLSP